MLNKKKLLLAAIVFCGTYAAHELSIASAQKDDATAAQKLAAA